jgi:two-component system sensor histidine kinase/response regulator
MENSIRRMEVLVNDLLNISFIEMGMFKLHRRCCNIAELCRDLVDEYVAGTNPSPTILLDIADEKLEADVDIERLGQVIINLLSNARKYSPTGSPIYFSLQCDDGCYVISVRDLGVGIPPEVLPHIFERFYRAPGVEVQTGSSIGFGLGLYISQQIVARHGGHIEVKSSPAAGSTFSIVLPLPAQQSTDPQGSRSYSH